MAAPISALGLRMDDDVIRVATGLCLGLPLCRPHVYMCKLQDQGGQAGHPRTELSFQQGGAPLTTCTPQ